MVKVGYSKNPYLSGMGRRRKKLIIWPFFAKAN
jgi:hypothetical protein